MANYYDTVVIPARVRKAKDKAKVEVAVQVVERWILARLRNRQFFSLRQLNETIAKLLVELNNRVFQKLPGCRKQLFESLDKPALKPLPVQPYPYAEWKIAGVNIDYHIEVDRHYYSVPHELIGKKIDVRITETTIECFYKSKSVASHIRSYLKGRHTTVKEHMPKSHQQWAKWNPQRFINWAAKIGPHTAQLIELILNSRKHPQQGFRSCLGILRLAKSYDDQRLEAACQRAVTIGGTSYKSVASILKHNLDQKPLPLLSLKGDLFMLMHPILDKLQSLRFFGMLSALEEQMKMPDIEKLNFEDRFGLLVDRETADRQNRRFKTRLRKAKLAQKACQLDYSALYFRLPRLLQQLDIAKGDGRYAKMLKSIAKTNLLVIDDWGLKKLIKEQSHDLLEIFEDRHRLRSTLITSQLPVDHWHEIVGNPTLADAILDRLVHNAYRINLKGESMRKKKTNLTQNK
jgi:transposase